MSEPLTPDFYAHRWDPLVHCELTRGFVTVTWADGTTLDCYALWLAENSYGLEPLTRESTIDPTELPAPDDLLAATVGGDGELVTRWRDGTEARLHPGWLRHVAEGRHAPGAYLPEPVPWTTGELNEPPTTIGATVLDEVDVLRAWTNDLCRYGAARLVGTPTDDDLVGAVASTLGPVRGSNFGAVFEVAAITNPDSTANTGLGLGQHTDLPTREIPPGFQLLHCVENGVAGGWSRLTDGLALVEAIRADHPHHYEALTSLHWTFANRSPSADHRWTAPIIDLIGPGHPVTIRAFYPVRAVPAMDRADIPRAYEAMRVFSTLASDPAFQLRFPFSPGDLLAFDNRRILHGRDPFDPSSGRRRLRGCYLDHDDVHSTLRLLNRHAEAAATPRHPSTPLPFPPSQPSRSTP